jgi:hypothetical protein
MTFATGCRLLLLAALPAALAGCGGTGGLVVAGTTTPATATSPAGVTTTPPPVARTLSEGTRGGARVAAAVYFLRSGRVSPVRRSLAVSGGQSGIWPELVHALLRGPSAVEHETGTTTAFAPAGGSPFDFDNLSVSATSGIASIDLPGAVAEGGGGAVRARLAQLVFTLTQSPDVTGVSVSIGGRTVASVPGLGLPGRPLDRNDFEAETPPILIESPLAGDAPACPLRVSGTANTFEGTFLIAPLDDAGHPLAAPRNVNATSGSGTRGTFDVSVPCPSGRLPARIAAYTECVSGEGSCNPARGANRIEVPLKRVTR